LLLFPIDMIDTIINFTNSNGDIKIDNVKQKKLKKRQWKHIDRTKILYFIGMLITMGIVKKPSLRDYWETISLTYTPGFTD